MESRRGFLKMLGIGSTVAPIVNGLMVPGAHAKLIEEPRYEVIEAKKIPAGDAAYEMCKLGKILHMQVTLTDDDNRSVTFQGKTFITEFKRDVVDVTQYGDIYRRLIPGRLSVGWELRGQLVDCENMMGWE